ncbi:MAG: RrF2 family transcriptional regulator [Myxococcota bacterium]
MLKLNRRTEYALLALRYLSLPGREVASVRAVANHYTLPEPLLAKVLQLLKRGGITSATKGAMGGYTLARPLEEVPLMELLQLFDESTALVGCIEETTGCDCHLHPSCEIRDGMSALNQLMTAQLRHLTVASFFDAGRTAQTA